MLRLLINLLTLFVTVRDFCVFSVDETPTHEATMIVGNVTLLTVFTFSFNSCWLTYQGNLQRSTLQYLDVSYWHRWMNGIRPLLNWERKLTPITNQQLTEEGEMYLEDWLKLQ